MTIDVNYSSIIYVISSLHLRGFKPEKNEKITPKGARCNLQAMQALFFLATPLKLGMGVIDDWRLVCWRR